MSKASSTKYSEGVRIAAISALTSILTAIITAVVTIYTTSSSVPRPQAFEVKNGKPVEVSSSHQIVEFWTPSAATWASGQPEWQKIDDQRVIKFAEYLKEKARMSGYNRFPVWGEGRMGIKAGWWWSVTIGKDVNLTELAKIYADFWKSDAPVYFRILGTQPRETYQ